MSGPAQVIILGEDQAHVGSVYRAVVDHLGIPSGKVRKRPVSQGKGDAKQYVLKKVSDEIRLLRRGPRSASLIIVLDGDGATHAEREGNVQSELESAKAVRLSPTERVAVLVPCRNIETWLEFARCTTVDEATDYKSGRRSSWRSEDFQRVGGILGKFPCPKDNPPPSLDAARTRLQAMTS